MKKILYLKRAILPVAGLVLLIIPSVTVFAEDDGQTNLVSNYTEFNPQILGHQNPHHLSIHLLDITLACGL